MGHLQVSPSNNETTFDCEIAFDVITNLGTFAELEITAEEAELEQAKSALEQLRAAIEPSG